MSASAPRIVTVANPINNSSGDTGGGIYAGGFAVNVPGSVSIVNSTISGNSAATGGGGIYKVRASLQVANSTIAGNSAGSGGAFTTRRDNVVHNIVELTNTILKAGASGENIFSTAGTDQVTWLQSQQR